MLAGLLTALSLWPHLHARPPAAPPPPSRVDHYQQRFDGWWVDYAQDRFAERLTCRVHTAGPADRARAEFDHGALVFRLGPDVDTQTAVYRLDGGAPVSADRYRLRLARAGLPRPQPTLGAADGGLVVLPAEALRGGSRIDIRPAEGARIARFRLDGAWAALDAARRQGCAV